MKRFHIKYKWLLILGILIVLSVTIAGNFFLSKSRRMVMDIVAEQGLSHNLSFGKMFYLFPNYVIIKNLILSKSLESSAAQPCILPTVVVRFSPFALIKREEVLITDILLHKSTLNYQEFNEFVQDNFPALVEIVEKIPKEDIKIQLKDVVVNLGPQGDKAGYIWTDFNLTLQGDTVSGTGLMRRDKYSFALSKGAEPKVLSRGLPLKCVLKGFITPDGFALENLSFTREDIHIKFWANYSEDMLQLNGFALQNTPQTGVLGYKRIVKDMVNKFKSPAYRQESSLTVEGLSQKSFFILDMDCRLTVALPWIHIENFKFTVNNAPVSIKGDIFVSDPPSLDLAVTFFPAHSGRFRADNLERIDFKVAGALENIRFKSDASVNIYFKDKTDPTHSPDRLEIEFKDLAFSLENYAQLMIALGKSRTSFWSNNNIHTVRLNDLAASLNFRNENFKYFKLQAPFYEGSLKGKVWVDTVQAPFKISSSFVLDNVNANKLDELLVHFSKVEGKLFSNINFTNYPEFNLSGGINVQKGVLADYEFFNWLSDLFDLPSLKKINFTRASTNFSVGLEKAGLHDIKLEADDMSIGGYFSIATNSLVSSKIGISLGRAMLAQSKKCRMLLQLFDPDMPALDFGFKLSGNQHAMNFQWMPSDVKRRIQDRIPDFIERHIERSIDDSLAPVPRNHPFSN